LKRRADPADFVTLATAVDFAAVDEVFRIASTTVVDDPALLVFARLLSSARLTATGRRIALESVLDATLLVALTLPTVVAAIATVTHLTAFGVLAGFLPIDGGALARSALARAVDSADFVVVAAADFVIAIDQPSTAVANQPAFGAEIVTALDLGGTVVFAQFEFFATLERFLETANLVVVTTAAVVRSSAAVTLEPALLAVAGFLLVDGLAQVAEPRAHVALDDAASFVIIALSAVQQVAATIGDLAALNAQVTTACRFAASVRIVRRQQGRVVGKPWRTCVAFVVVVVAVVSRIVVGVGRIFLAARQERGAEDEGK
jgi:hypothetical protein